MENNKTVVLIKIWRGTGDVGQPPMGLLFLGNELKKNGYTVKVFHWTHSEALDNVDVVLKNSPMLVGFSMITGDPLGIILEFCKRLKGSNSNIPIVFGGVHPTLEPRQCLMEDCVDYVVLQEGEKTIVSLANAVRDALSLTTINGLGYKKNGQAIVNPFIDFEDNIDRFDMDWSLIGIEQYIRPSYAGFKRVLMGYVASRGCPHNCGFCYNQVFNSRKWRCQSTSKVIKDINRLTQEFRLGGIVFYDDNFTVNKKWALEILKGIRLPGINIETRIDYIDDEFVKGLVESNVKSILLGVESGSDRLLKLISKGFSVEDIYRGLNILKKYPIAIKLSLIVGIPTEQLSEYRATLKLVFWSLENLPEVGFTIGFYLPYPGTPLFDLCAKMGFKKPESLIEWKVLERHGNENMLIPWVEGGYLTSLEVKKIRTYLAWALNLKKDKFYNWNLFYKLLKFRIIYSGTFYMRVCSKIENILWPILRIFIKMRNSVKLYHR